MANFRIYNVQLLPNTENEKEVGVAGYKRLFAEFREATRQARVAKNLLAYHRDVGRDAHFGPHEFHVEAGYVWGKFIRYRRTDQVDDLNTMKPLFKEGSKQVGVASRNEILFIFDCKDHFLAIEEGGGTLPSPMDFLRILHDYLNPLSVKLFPSHSLHILLIADKKSLDMVFEKATSFSHIEVELTFPNGSAEESLEQLKRSRIQKLSLVGAPGYNGSISKELPPFLIGLIKGAIKFGRTKLTYYRKNEDGKGELKREKFDSAEMPMKFEKRRVASETTEEFVERCIADLREAVGHISPAESEVIDLDS